MNKKFTYLILIVCFFSLSAFVVIKYNVKLGKKKNTTYTLLERSGNTAKLTEWESTRNTANTLFRKVNANPGDLTSAIALAALYIQEARITGNYVYYNAAAMKYIEDVLEVNPRQFEALILKAVIQLSYHHFNEALETAVAAQKINPYNSYVYGIMVDANVELGNYQKAVECSDKMVSIRPDLRSYARISYLREIHGDYPGAIEAMKMAVDAGAYGEESTEWSRVQLARLFELTGALKKAEMQYTLSTDARPGFSPALAGLARIAITKKQYDEAIRLLQQAAVDANDNSIKEQLAEVYQLAGHENKANEVLNGLITSLNAAAAEGEEGGINHHADKELTSIYLLTNDFSKALHHARLEYNRRPDNIELNEAVAWANYKNNNADEALIFMEKALKTNSKNPTLLCRAAAVYMANNNKAKARILLQEALVNDPNMDTKLKDESKKLLHGL